MLSNTSVLRCTRFIFCVKEADLGLMALVHTLPLGFQNNTPCLFAGTMHSVPRKEHPCPSNAGRWFRQFLVIYRCLAAEGGGGGGATKHRVVKPTPHPAPRLPTPTRSAYGIRVQPHALHLRRSLLCLCPFFEKNRVYEFYPFPHCASAALSKRGVGVEPLFCLFSGTSAVLAQGAGGGVVAFGFCGSKWRCFQGDQTVTSNFANRDCVLVAPNAR